jgi:hypothetical protein
MILEDMSGGKPGVADPVGQRIALARDFVSHGKITRKACKSFLAEELGRVAEEYRYDPDNQGAPQAGAEIQTSG